METPAEHMEHIEHHQHAAHNPFDKRVAMTMAIVAALLAAVTMLSHRAHNDTILYKTQASNEWSFYQAKNIRQHQYDAMLLLLNSVTKDPAGNESAEKARGKWSTQVKKYDEELPKMKEEAERLEEASHTAHLQSARFDLGELGIELALIFSSLAVLTKRAGFWYSGMGCGIVGVAVAASGFFIHGH